MALAVYDTHFLGRGVGYRAYQLVHRVSGALLLYLLRPQGIECVQHDILIVLIKGNVVAFFFHRLHLPLAFLFLRLRRLVLLHALIHIALDFAQNITHRAKLAFERLRIHPLILFG